MVTSVALYLGFLLLLALERLLELGLSARHAERLRRRGAYEVGQRHFALLVVLHALFLPACAAEVLLLHRSFPGVVGGLALIAALAAQALRYWAVMALGERWNVRIFVLDDVSPVVSGPYRYLRHPNYVAVLVEIACVPLIHGAWLTAVVFSLAHAALLAVRIRQEEAALGPLYGTIFSSTPRFLPRSGC